MVGYLFMKELIRYIVTESNNKVMLICYLMTKRVSISCSDVLPVHCAVVVMNIFAEFKTYHSTKKHYPRANHRAIHL